MGAGKPASPKVSRNRPVGVEVHLPVVLVAAVRANTQLRARIGETRQYRATRNARDGSVGILGRGDGDNRASVLETRRRCTADSGIRVLQAEVARHRYCQSTIDDGSSHAE